MPKNDEPVSARELTKVTDFELDAPEYIQWKREKIERALRHADEHPEDSKTEQEIWNKHGIEY